jgi:exopolysaccharide biosynthesis operon protein EpsL
LLHALARVLLASLACALAAAAAAQQESVPAEDDEERMGEEREEGEEEAAAGEPRAAATSALPDRPLMLRAGASYTRDTNLFRAPDARADNVGTAYVGLGLDKAYAQQRFRLDITETAYRYQNFSHLDFEGLNYLGAWNWQLGPRIGGTLSATRAQSLADYSEFRNPGQQNVRTTENFAAGADAWLFGGWHLTGALTQVRNRYSVPFPQEGSYEADGREAGVRWVAPSANWLALNQRVLDGRYVDRPLDPAAQLDDGFRRSETEALAAWRVTGKSSFEGRVAWIDYVSDNFSARDFSGIAAGLRFLWQASVKLGINAALAREVEPWADTSASYRVDQRVSLGASWQPAARATLRLEARRGESDFREPLPAFAGRARRDKEASVQLSVEWRARRNLTLSAGVQRYRQSSSDPAANFHGTQLTAGASFLF